MSEILVINGPNINMLGKRENDIYGDITYESLISKIDEFSLKKNLKAQFFQSNAEHEIVSTIQSSIDQNFDFIILNPAAFTHSSIAMRDALLAVKIPFIEVHLSNIYAREDFRKKSYFSDIATGVIAGFGFRGYFLAIDYISGHLKERR